MRGTQLESKAAAYLEAFGYRIIARNFRTRSGEIDLIAEIQLDRGIELVFIEVRLRGLGAWASAPESITRAKRARLDRAARIWLETYRGRARSMRFDLVYSDGNAMSHVPDAWRGC